MIFLPLQAPANMWKVEKTAKVSHTRRSHLNVNAQHDLKDSAQQPAATIADHTQLWYES